MFGLTATASFDVLADVERELSGNGAFPLDADTTVRYENTNRLELQYKVEKIEVLSGKSKWDIFKTKNNSIASLISEMPKLMEDLQRPDNIKKIKSKFVERENLDFNSPNVKKILNIDFSRNFPIDWLNNGIPYEFSGIVFCPHRSNSIGVEDGKNKGIASTLENNLNISKVGRFKGGDETNDQDNFKNNELPIMVATKAFGMGIDKPNVRFTINVNMSSSLEGFVQEAGRAGRDRRMALATIMYSDFKQVDKDVQMYFYDINFRGVDIEKQTMFRLLSRNEAEVSIFNDEGYETGTETIAGFLEKYLALDYGSNIIAYLKYPKLKYENNLYDNVFYIREDNKQVEVLLIKEHGNEYVDIKLDDNVETVHKKRIVYKSDIDKAIYRMCCIELIDDFTQDYLNNRFRIVAKRKANGEYYQGLKRFLMRYYPTDKAEQEIKKAKDYKGENEIHKCLGYLTGFIYENIAEKRKRTIEDMNTFCIQGIDVTKDWKDVNEDLKDFIYFYFNSKYAKDNYVANNGEFFSLTKDTKKGKKSLPEIVLKYMRVVDFNDTLFNPGDTPKDNAKHLQGAVRLIRRSLTGENPTIDMLNAFCLLFLGTNNNEALEEELINSYSDGINGFYESTNNYRDFWSFFEDFHYAVSEKANEYPIKNLINLKDELIAALHLKIIESLTKKYTT